jgi:sodium transport system permease protein
MTATPRLDLRKIRIVFFRELRDQIRDRRTLFMVLALPVLLYPALGIGMLQMAVLFNEKPRTVVVLGSNSLPEPQLIQASAFDSRWFSDPDDARKLIVETSESASAKAADNPDALRRLEIAKTVQRLYQQRQQLIDSNQDTPQPHTPTANPQLARLNESINAMLRDAHIDVLVLIPDGFRDRLEQVNRLIAARTQHNNNQDPDQADADYPRPVILVNGDEKSTVASRRVERVFEAWEQELLRIRLEAAGLPTSLPAPVAATVVQVVGDAQKSALVWSKLYPIILVVMTVTGAFYPAVDLAAGEKERGTMETLLISPVRRIELVLAKFFTVLVFSLTTALLNLVSLGLTATYMFQLVAQVNPDAGIAVVAPSIAGMLWILVMLVPLAALFSALSLALATFARSTREGQYYLTPLMIVVMLLVAMTAAPGIEIQPFHSVLPVIGPVLLLKQLMLDPDSAETLAYLPAVLAASFAYAGLALWWAVAQFQSESVLFREAERFDLRLWLRRLRTHKPNLPGPPAAWTCLGIAMLGQLLLMQPLGNWLASLDSSQQPRAAIYALIAQQVLLFLFPALLLACTLLKDVRATFRLRKPTVASLALATTLAVALHPLVHELMNHLQWFFPPGLPEGSRDFLEEMLGPTQPAWLVLLAIAITPAVCEEFLFRGYVLSAFNRPGRHTLAVVISAVAFGAVHMIPQQVFYATLLGLVLGLLAIRTRSIWPGLLFHFTFNAISVIQERMSVAAGGSGLHYDWPVLVPAALVALALLVKLGRATTPPDTSGNSSANASGSPA